MLKEDVTMLDVKPQASSDEKLHSRIQFLEAQCRSLQMNIKYQRYHLLETDEKTINLLLRLVPYKLRSAEKIRALANSNLSWKQILWRHPLKIKLWMTARRLQRGQTGK